MARDNLGLAIVEASRENPAPRSPLPLRHYSLADLLRVLRALRLVAGFSASSPAVAADLRARRGLASSVPARLRVLRGRVSVSASASSPVSGRSGTDSTVTGSGAGRCVSTTPTESRSGGTVPTPAPLGHRPRPRPGGALLAPMPVGVDAAGGVTAFGGSTAASCSTTEVGAAAGATS